MYIIYITQNRAFIFGVFKFQKSHPNAPLHRLYEQIL